MTANGRFSGDLIRPMGSSDAVNGLIPQARGRDVIAELQEALLPRGLPVLPQARLGARYLVAAEDQAAGGDWFDAIPLPGGAVALVVGDVVGHGIAASAAMGQLRAVLKQLLLTGTELGSVLAQVDTFAAAERPLRAATLAVVVLDPVTGDLRYSVCGQPEPLVIHADGTATFLSEGGTGPLGVGRTPAVVSGHLDEDALVLLYSDGLVERPGRTLREGVEELADVAADAATSRVLAHEAAVSQPERVCRLTVEVLTRTGYDDDVTTLAAQRMPNSVPPLAVELPAVHDSLVVARTAIRDWLARLQVGETDQELLALAVSEAITNSIEHAYASASPGPVGLTAELGADGVCTSRVTDHGRWRAPDQTSRHRGFGLLLCERVVDEITVSHPPQRAGEPVGARGTVVTLRHRLHRPAVLDFFVVTASQAGDRVFGSEIIPGEDTTTVRVHGSIGVTTAKRFAHDLTMAAHGGVLPLTVDLTEVTELGSAGVHVLYEMSAQLAAHRQPLVLLAAPDSAAAFVLDLVHLPHLPDMR